MSNPCAKISHAGSLLNLSSLRLLSAAGNDSRLQSRVDQDEADINDQVRGLIPWPVATTVIQGKNFKIFRVEDTGTTTDAPSGKLLALTKKGLEIACGDGTTLRIVQLQGEGGKRMAAADYLRGHSVQVGV